LTTLVGQYWLKSHDNPVEPAPYPYGSNNTEEAEKLLGDSVRRGWDVFRKDKAEGGGACLACHLDYGRHTLYRYDEWGTMVRPANVTAGIYRGGRRPIDLYWRVYRGIEPSGMLSNPDLAATDASGQNKLWDVVNFLQALPYPKMREKYGLDIDAVRMPTANAVAAAQ
jgi:hypothetical protein